MEIFLFMKIISQLIPKMIFSENSSPKICKIAKDSEKGE